jgi:cytochrome c
MRAMMILGAALAFAPVGAAVAQDAAAGQRVFNQCRACHTINEGGRNGVGPNLHGVWERPAASVQGFRYSANMQEVAQGGLVWNEANLRRYLTDPKDVVPRGSMAFAGIRNEEQLNNLLAYLQAQR